MHVRLTIVPSIAFLAGVLVNCGERESAPHQELHAPAPAEPEAHNGQGLPGFFTPRPGETWTYAVHRDVPPQTVLNDDDQLRSSDLPGGGYRFSLERQRVCLGPMTPANAEGELTVIELSEDGVTLGQEYLDIGADGMVARGWNPVGTPPAKLQLLTPGVLLASPLMAGGQVWTSTGTNPNQEFQFRVLERTMVTVPAGTYEAVRLQMNSGTGKRAVRRTLWFAENVGIIKEETIYFNESKITMREASELTSWTQPAPEARETPAAEPEPTEPTGDFVDPDPIERPAEESTPEPETLSFSDSLEKIIEEAIMPQAAADPSPNGDTETEQPETDEEHRSDEPSDEDGEPGES